MTENNHESGDRIPAARHIEGDQLQPTAPDKPALKAAAERYVCTRQNPWSPSKGLPAEHPDAKDDGECSDGCCDFYKCPNCGTRWRQEVAQ